MSGTAAPEKKKSSPLRILAELVIVAVCVYGILVGLAFAGIERIQSFIFPQLSAVINAMPVWNEKALHGEAEQFLRNKYGQEFVVSTVEHNFDFLLDSVGEIPLGYAALAYPKSTPSICGLVLRNLSSDKTWRDGNFFYFPLWEHALQQKLDKLLGEKRYALILDGEIHNVLLRLSPDERIESAKAAEEIFRQYYRAEIFRFFVCDPALSDDAALRANTKQLVDEAAHVADTLSPDATFSRLHLFFAGKSMEEPAEKIGILTPERELLVSGDLMPLLQTLASADRIVANMLFENEPGGFSLVRKDFKISDVYSYGFTIERLFDGGGFFKTIIRTKPLP